VSDEPRIADRVETRAPEVTITFGDMNEQRSERRSRFDSLTTFEPGPGRFAARVKLEWDGEMLEGVSEGDRNQFAELRICASATLRAVERIADGNATFNVIGVKELQVFDHNLVVVLILSPQLPEQRLIGTAFITKDRRTAAALAALNATNRIVGRFISE
jgi:hypothetical protein